MSAKNNNPCLNANPSSEPKTKTDADIAVIRLLNDRLRKFGSGGQVLITDGVLDGGLKFAQKAIEAVAQFENFNDDNDPWQEHDCASLTVDGHRIIWKIDLYEEQNVNRQTEVPIVTRVLTIMLAEEY